MRFLFMLAGILLMSALAPAQLGAADRCGDVDTDGVVSVLDALSAALHGTGARALDPAAAARGDVDGDGDVDVLDALLIAQSAVGLPASLTCVPAPGGERAYIARSGRIAVHDVATALLMTEIPLAGIGSTAVDPTRDLFYVSSGTADILVHESTTFAPVGSVPLPPVSPLANHTLQVTPDGAALLVLAAEGLGVTPLTGGAPRAVILPERPLAARFAISPDSWRAYLATATAIHEVTLSNSAVRSIPTTEPAYDLAISADGRTLFSAAYQAGVAVAYDVASGTVTWGPVVIGPAARHPVPLPGGELCVFAQAASMAFILDGMTGAVLRTYGLPLEPVAACSCPSGELLIQGTHRGARTSLLFDAMTGPGFRFQGGYSCSCK